MTNWVIFFKFLLFLKKHYRKLSAHLKWQMAHVCKWFSSNFHCVTFSIFFGKCGTKKNYKFFTKFIKIFQNFYSSVAQQFHNIPKTLPNSQFNFADMQQKMHLFNYIWFEMQIRWHYQKIWNFCVLHFWSKW